MRKALSYVLTVPACTLFFLAELVRGEKIAWRAEEIINRWLAGKPPKRCTKCGHTGQLFIDNENKTNSV